MCYARYAQWHVYKQFSVECHQNASTWWLNSHTRDILYKIRKRALYGIIPTFLVFLCNFIPINPASLLATIGMSCMVVFQLYPKRKSKNDIKCLLEDSMKRHGQITLQEIIDFKDTSDKKYDSRNNYLRDLKNLYDCLGPKWSGIWGLI